MSKTIIVIGGGPGGYTTAIRAAQLGASVHLVESGSLGGTCLNVGCIPTKSLLHGANLFQEIGNASNLGINTDGLSLDWAKMQKHKEQVVKRLVNGVAGLLAANGVEVHQGHAALIDANTIVIGGEKEIKADILIIASGSEPQVIPFEGWDLPGVINSTDALSLSGLPKSIGILGGGVIGTEFAHLFSALGVKVSIIEMLPGILATMDGQVASAISQKLKNQNVSIYTDTRLEKVEQAEAVLSVKANTANEDISIEFEKLIVAVGRRANTGGMNLEEIGVEMDRGMIRVDNRFRTSVPNIYAIGDCNGKSMLAHAAAAQGVSVVEFCLEETFHYDENIIPGCVYTNPEAASVGLTEEQASAAGMDYKTGLFLLAGNGKSMIEGCSNGFIKILAAEDGRVVGAHMVGPRVTDMITEISAVMTMGGSIDDIRRTIHPHPTVSEAVEEAALAVDGQAINWPPVR